MCTTFIAGKGLWSRAERECKAENSYNPNTHSITSQRHSLHGISFTTYSNAKRSVISSHLFFNEHNWSSVKLCSYRSHFLGRGESRVKNCLSAIISCLNHLVNRRTSGLFCFVSECNTIHSKNNKWFEKHENFCNCGCVNLLWTLFTFFFFISFVYVLIFTHLVKWHIALTLKSKEKKKEGERRKQRKGRKLYRKV